MDGPLRGEVVRTVERLHVRHLLDADAMLAGD